MICPHCGAEIRDQLPSCQMCHKDIDRDHFYAQFILKGDEAMINSTPDAALNNYTKALSFINDKAEIYVRMGNALNKKGDKKAAPMYLKALEHDFYDKKVHSLLITLYDRFNQLDNLKGWYEQNRREGNNEFVDKHISIIDNIKIFKNDESMIIKDTIEDGVIKSFFSSMKKYAIMNIVFGIVAVLGVVGVAGVYVFKLDMKFVIMFSGLFFVVSIIIIIYFRIMSVRKMNKERMKPETVLADFRMPEQKTQEEVVLDPKLEALLKEAEEERGGKKK